MDVNFLMEALELLEKGDIEKMPTEDLALIVPILHKLNDRAMSELIEREFFNE